MKDRVTVGYGDMEAVSMPAGISQQEYQARLLDAWKNGKYVTDTMDKAMSRTLDEEKREQRKNVSSDDLRNVLAAARKKGLLK